jgi:hypothetical protein
MLRKTLAAAVAAGFVTVSAGGARADLVTNGNFATGDFTGWTVVGDGISIDTAFANTGDTYDASFSAMTGEPNAGILSQQITTTPGASYNLSFALLDEAGYSFDTFTVSFGGFTATITGDQASGGYALVPFSIPGADITSTSTTLSFQGMNSLSADWNLDDVSLTPANMAGIPGPVAGAGLPGIIFASIGLLLWLRWHRKPGLSAAH